MAHSRGGTLGQDQVDFERGAFIDLAVDMDHAPMLIDKTVDRCQAEACALSNAFGGIERFKDAGKRFFVYSTTRVRDAQ